MAEWRTSFVQNEEAVIHGDEREQLFGVPIQDRLDPGERTAGFLRSLGQGFAVDGLGYARDQWASLRDVVFDDDQETLTVERYEELRDDPILGKIDVPFQPGMTVRQFRNNLRRHKRDSYMQTFDRSVAGQGTRFLGAMGGGMLAPEVLSTIWVGGPAIRAATQAGTTAQFMRQSALAATQISAATVPLNIQAQQAVYGNVDPLETVLTGVAPFVFIPAGAAFGRAFTPREQRAAADAASTPAPTGVREPADNYVPASLNDEFANYPGGAPKWLDDIAQNRPEAFEYGRGIGLTDDALGEVKQRTFVEASRTPAGREEILDFDALDSYAGGTATEAQVARLRERGLLERAEELAMAEETPAFAQTTEQRLVARSADERRADIERQYPEMVDALRYRDYVRAGGRPTVPDGFEGVATDAVGRARSVRSSSRAVRQQAENMRRAVDEENPQAVPASMRPMVERLIEANRVEPDVRRVAYREESRQIDLLGRAAEGDTRSVRQFSEQMMEGMPEHARGDWQAFTNNGIEGLRARFVERKIAETNELAARLGHLQERRRGRRGRPPRAEREVEQRLNNNLREVDELIADVRSRQTKRPQKVSVDDVADILNASRFKRAEPGRFESARQQETPEATATARDKRPPTRADDDRLTDLELDEIVQYARQNGVDFEQVNNSYSAAARAITECQI